jgi:hypothetical protein
MMTNQEEIQIAVNKIVGFIYGMYIKDLKAKNTANRSPRKKAKGNDKGTLFNYTD